MAVLQGANHIIALDRVFTKQNQDPKGDKTPRKNAFLQAIRLAKKGYTLCGAMPQVKAYQKELAFFDAVRATIIKNDAQAPSQKQDNERQLQLLALVNQAIVADGAVDLFALANEENPNISILSEEFLEFIKHGNTQDL